MLNLDAIRARLNGITPGDYIEITDDSKVIICGVLPLFVLTKRAGSTEDTEFIAHAPADIRALLDEVERLQAKLTAYKDALDACTVFVPDSVSSTSYGSMERTNRINALSALKKLNAVNAEMD